MPHRDDVARFATLRPDHDHQPAVELARGYKMCLTIIEPVVDDRRGAALEHFAGPRDIEPAMPARQFPLRRIEGDLPIIVPPINVKATTRCFTQPSQL